MVAPLKISVVTVVFNRRDTIEDALRSVASQGYGNVEHIVVDGGSRDGTMDVLNAYRDQIDVLVSEADRGIYDAMNKGVRLANGDVVAFLNADDVYAHDEVIAGVAKLMQLEHLDALLGDAAFFRPDDPLRRVRRYDSSRFSPKRIAWGWMPAHSALFLRREVFERVGAFRTDYRIAGDFEFIARAFWPGNLRYQHMPEILVNMRTGGISTSGWRNTLLLNREVLRACRENGIPTNLLKILSKYPAKLLEFLRP
jgi:glycosyltransferase involved in cell wall biosynthesis